MNMSKTDSNLGQVIYNNGQMNLDKTLRKSLKNKDSLESELRNNYHLDSIIGHHPKIVNILKFICQIAKTQATVLIQGETGTGKELVARALHENSDRKDQAFVPVNCAAIPENLMESELFGHQRGAFTGAVQNKKGWFEIANEGTIFLDEVNEMPSSLQIKLLRVLQSKEYHRLGSTEIQKSNARVIAASSGNLKDMVANGSFRKEAFFRLSVIEIDLPSLRERKSDITTLVEYFLDHFSKQYDRKMLKFSKGVLTVFQTYDFPGNIRELEHAIHHAVIVAENDLIQINQLPKSMHIETNRETPKGVSTFKQAKQNAVESFEKEYIIDCLKISMGNITQAAKYAGLHVTNLHSKIKKYNINPYSFKVMPG